MHVKNDNKSNTKYGKNSWACRETKAKVKALWKFQTCKEGRCFLGLFELINENWCGLWCINNTFLFFWPKNNKQSNQANQNKLSIGNLLDCDIRYLVKKSTRTPLEAQQYGILEGNFYLEVTFHHLRTLNFNNALWAMWKNFTGLWINNFYFGISKGTPTCTYNLQIMNSITRVIRFIPSKKQGKV